ncbi:hypothetical protein TNCV_4261271 [Trichonephila clavipes]|nr:hypothetical protein TNCV_4261271 [Trichonephila clavipes]
MVFDVKPRLLSRLDGVVGLSLAFCIQGCGVLIKLATNGHKKKARSIPPIGLLHKNVYRVLKNGWISQVIGSLVPEVVAYLASMPQVPGTNLKLDKVDSSVGR